MGWLLSSANHHIVLKTRLGRIRKTGLHTAATHHTFDAHLHAKADFKCATGVVLICAQVLIVSPLM